MAYQKVAIPSEGRKITMGPSGVLAVPDNPIIPFIEGDGIGPDITRAAMAVWNAAVEKAYAGKRKVAWMEVYAGEKANAVYGPNTWLPAETLEALREHLVGIEAGCRAHGHELGASLRQRAGLVERGGADARELLDDRAALEDHPGLRSA